MQFAPRNEGQAAFATRIRGVAEPVSECDNLRNEG